MVQLDWPILDNSFELDWWSVKQATFNHAMQYVTWQWAATKPVCPSQDGVDTFELSLPRRYFSECVGLFRLAYFSKYKNCLVGFSNEFKVRISGFNDLSRISIWCICEPFALFEYCKRAALDCWRTCISLCTDITGTRFNIVVGVFIRRRWHSDNNTEDESAVDTNCSFVHVASCMCRWVSEWNVISLVVSIIDNCSSLSPQICLSTLLYLVLDLTVNDFFNCVCLCACVFCV